MIWIVGLAAVAAPDPAVASDWTLCVFHSLGLELCPGCGLGHSIGFLVRGAFAASFEAHPLGVPIFAVLLARSGNLIFDWRRQTLG